VLKCKGSIFTGSADQVRNCSNEQMAGEERLMTSCRYWEIDANVVALQSGSVGSWAW
jgi:hypothetical protein